MSEFILTYYIKVKGMNKNSLSVMFVLLAGLMLTGFAKSDETGKYVTQKKMSGYFQTDIDVSDASVSRKVAGKEYGKLIIQQVPAYEKLIDSYLAEIQKMVGKIGTYEDMIGRMKNIWANVPQTVQDELAGIAEAVCSTQENVLGDGKLSPDELRMFNLIADVYRGNQCSMVGALPEMSETGNVILARNLDWDDGSTFQFSQIQSIATYRLPNKRSLTLVGYLGVIIGVTGFVENIDGKANPKDGECLYFALLDSEIGKPYTSKDKRSYPSDLRKYAEECTSIESMVSMLDKTEDKYTFGHLIVLADSKNIGVYEGDLNYGEHRLRTAKDNPDLYIPWKVKGTIGAVNCFMLKTSYDNATGKNDPTQTPESVRLADGNISGDSNKMRWASQQRLLSANNGAKFSMDNLKAVETYGPGKTSEGFIFRYDTLQTVLFEPKTRHLEVAFHPIGRNWNKDEKPVFQKIIIKSAGEK